MPSQRGVKAFWLDIPALEADRTHLIAEHGAKQGMLMFGVWVRIFTWQYHTAKPITGPDHVARLTGLHIHTARLLWHSLCHSLPHSLVQREGGWYCKRTSRVLDNYNKNQQDGGATSVPLKQAHSYSDLNSDLRSSLLPSQDSGSGEILEPVQERTFPKKVQRPRVPFKEIVELYHQVLPELPAVEKLTETRKGYIRQRWAEDLPDLEHWGNYFHFVRKSRFLMGKTEPTNGRPPFQANLEWLTRPSNFTKVAEEQYHHG